MTHLRLLVTFAVPITIALAMTACAAPVEEDTSSTSQAAYAGERISAGQIAAAARQAGLPCNTIVTATAVALGESEGYLAATHVNDDGSVDRGLWQINSYYWPMYSTECVFDAACNAKAMAAISSNGSNWQPWLAYTNGRYKMFLAEAEAAYASAGCSAGGGGTTPSAGGISGTVAGTGGIGLSIRASASTAASKIGALAEGETVTITCQARGTNVEGNDVWNFLADRGGWVADRYVYTGADGFHPSAKRCP